MDCSLPGFFVHGIFQARVLEWVAISFSRGSSWPRNRTWVSRHCRQMVYPLRQQGSPIYMYTRTKTKTKIYSVTLIKTKGKLMGSMRSANNWNTSPNKTQQPQGKRNITSYVIYNDQHRIKNYETKQKKCDPWSKWKTVNRNLSMLENLSFVESINLQI